MEHRFYNKTKKQQIEIQIGIIFIALICISLFFLLSWLTKVYIIVIIAIPIVISIIAPFFDIPSMKKNGKLIYHSSLLLSEEPQNGIIKIHGGTLFDYFFVIDRKMNGKQRTNFILYTFLQGLLNLIEEKKKTNENEFIIQGTSYIINERTAKNVGFKIVETDNIQKMILTLNYFNLFVGQSFAKRRISFPKLSNIKTFETTVSELIQNEEFIKKLSNQLLININSPKRKN